MPAYLILQAEVADPDRYRDYASRTPAVLSRYGARFLTRGTPVTTLEGADFGAARMAIIEFPDADTLRAFYADPEYQTLIGVRQEAAPGGRLLMQDGVPGGVSA